LLGFLTEETSPKALIRLASLEDGSKDGLLVLVDSKAEWVLPIPEIAPMGDLSTDEGWCFDFADLICHAARTRPLPAGTILAAGTVSSADARRGFACVLEAGAHAQQQAQIPPTFLNVGDHIRFAAYDDWGRDLFGPIDQGLIAP
jgi:Fumarylacetoacetate (FAA) hydrolase family